MIWLIVMVIALLLIALTAIVVNSNEELIKYGIAFLIALVFMSMILGAEMQYKTVTKQCELELPRTEQCVMIAVPESSLVKGEEGL